MPKESQRFVCTAFCWHKLNDKICTCCTKSPACGCKQAFKQAISNTTISRHCSTISQLKNREVVWNKSGVWAQLVGWLHPILTNSSSNPSVFTIRSNDPTYEPIEYQHVPTLSFIPPISFHLTYNHFSLTCRSIPIFHVLAFT